MFALESQAGTQTSPPSVQCGAGWSTYCPADTSVSIAAIVDAVQAADPGVYCAMASSNLGNGDGALFSDGAVAVNAVIAPIASADVSYATMFTFKCADASDQHQFSIRYLCADNSITTAPQSCPTACAENEGKFFELDYLAWGPPHVGNPSSIDLGIVEAAELGKKYCVSSCRAQVTSVKCSLVSFDSSGTPVYDAACGATAKYLTSACSGDSTLTAENASISTPRDVTVGTSGGGAGVTGGGTVADSTNLAKIASNTAEMARALAEGTSDGTETPSDVTTSANAAVTKADEAIGQVNDATSSGMEGLRKSMETGELPQLGWSDRWIFNLSTFLGTAPANCATFPGISYKSFTANLNICSWLPYWIDLVTWALWMFTAWAMWSTIYSKKEGA
jgi:hypothetical protein